MIIVCGAGIAGLSFAISYKLNGGKEELIVLERGIDMESRRGEYSHSLSIRADVGGVEVLKDLGIYGELRVIVTPSRGFFIARAGNPIRLSIASDWFTRDMQNLGLRLTRFDLWKTLLKRAEELGVQVRFGHTVVGYNEGEGLAVETATGLQHFQANLIIAADGSRSKIRTETTKEGLNFLNTVIVGGILDGEAPPPVAKRHGIVAGNGCSIFATEESEGRVLVAVGYKVDRELDREKDLPAIKEKVLNLSHQFGPLQPFVQRSLNDPSLFITNCRDRLPIKGKKPFIFIGDASHAVSPFAGAGANMALVDGWVMGKFAATKGTDHGPLVDELEKETFAKWTRVISQQRRTVSLLHSDSFLTGIFKGILLRLLPCLFSPDYRWQRYAFFFASISLTIGLVYQYFIKG